jgi:hypothetical protein
MRREGPSAALGIAVIVAAAALFVAARLVWRQWQEYRSPPVKASTEGLGDDAQR